jgi:hypothetical protein
MSSCFAALLRSLRGALWIGFNGTHWRDERMHEADLNTGSSSLTKQSLEKAEEFKESASVAEQPLHYLCIHVSRGQRSLQGPSSAKRARLAERRRSRMDPASININKTNADPRTKRCSLRRGEMKGTWRRACITLAQEHERMRNRFVRCAIRRTTRYGMLDSNWEIIRASTSLNNRDGRIVEQDWLIPLLYLTASLLPDVKSAKNGGSRRVMRRYRGKLWAKRTHVDGWYTACPARVISCHQSPIDIIGNRYYFNKNIPEPAHGFLH